MGQTPQSDPFMTYMGMPFLGLPPFLRSYYFITKMLIEAAILFKLSVTNIHFGYFSRDFQRTLPRNPAKNA